jgi:hypothetical protein
MAQQMEPRPDQDDRAFKLAQERAAMLQGFYIHLVIYLVINGGLFLINLLTRGSDGTWWFYWPLLGWGVGVFVHAVTTFAGVFTDDWRERKAQQLYERDRRHHTA